MTEDRQQPGERDDLLESLRRHRGFLRYTVRDLTDGQAAEHPTVSALCLGGLIKHVAEVESGWNSFITDGPSALAGGTEEWNVEDYLAKFQMGPDERLVDLLRNYEQVASRTDALIGQLPSLDLSHPLPEAPWFESGAHWSARRVFLHIIAETAQHAGHADIIRESIDGAKTMG